MAELVAATHGHASRAGAPAGEAGALWEGAVDESS
jgi:hypothetical protein